ncbi:MAG: hypothetical protein HQ559_04995 [Lentisphaerae bacterium]|nr:hypothetical protein [Lentisphaerota bacterium]
MERTNITSTKNSDAARAAGHLKVFGVDYTHVELPDGADLYLTKHGYPWRKQLRPDMFWTDRDWFKKHSSNLFGHDHASGGSGTTYRISTKPVDGLGREIVMKWNRMAQDVPGDRDDELLFTAEFNSPFEEFALVSELRSAWQGLDARPVLTHKPLAIYVPAEHVDPWRTGRKEYRMRDIIKAHQEVPLDLYRRYAVVYEWIKGVDAQEAWRRGIIGENQMASLTLAADQDLSRLGFAVRDRKPQHIIVRTEKLSDRLVERGNRIPYALVDFELLERTPERAGMISARQRRQYLVRQAHRFEVSERRGIPPHLDAVKIFGVDYIAGPSESTGGRLWVVGRDPLLFDYFLPERWEHAPRTRLSSNDDVYQIVTKDDIHLVWKLSHVGDHPRVDPFKDVQRQMLEHGYNSPFEEVSFAIALSSAGLLTTMPRAIYEMHRASGKATPFGDQSRYNSHDDLAMPDGTPLLRRDRDYVVIWGYWNKPDEFLAAEDRDYYEPIDALKALHNGVLGHQEYMALMCRAKASMQAQGFDDLAFAGSHKLLSLDSLGSIVRDAAGQPEVRICNFETIRKI